MQLKDLEMDSGLANGILKRLIIRYWEEDNNIPPFFRNRTEEQIAQWETLLEAGRNGTLDLDLLVVHKETLFDDLRRANGCGIKTFNIIAKALKNKMGIVEMHSKEARQLYEIKQIIENKKYSDTPKDIIEKIMEVLRDE